MEMFVRMILIVPTNLLLVLVLTKTRSTIKWEILLVYLFTNDSIFYIELTCRTKILNFIELHNIYIEHIRSNLFSKT